MNNKDALREKIVWLRDECERLEGIVSRTQPGADRSAANERLANARLALMNAERELQDLTR